MHKLYIKLFCILKIYFLSMANLPQFQKNLKTLKEVLRIKLLNIKTDYVFKRVFGHIGNEDITKNFLSCILRQEVSNIELEKNTILEKDLIDDKIGILDIKAEINNNTNVDIEMQIIDKKNSAQRILFYCAKLFTKSLKSGKDYNSLKKSISILIADYELDILKEIPQYITKWNFREEDYSKIVLTDIMEIYIIELGKFKKFQNSEKYKKLDSWIKFIESSEVVDMSNKEIIKAKEVLEEISQDEHERYLAELREKYILDQNATEAAGYDKGLKVGHSEGLKEGLEKGHKQGIEQGKKENNLSIAKKMLEEKIPLETIIKITNLSKEDIENLK